MIAGHIVVTGAKRIAFGCVAILGMATYAQTPNPPASMDPQQVSQALQASQAGHSRSMATNDAGSTTTIEAEGKAEIEVAPTYVDFEFLMEGKGATLVEATQKAVAIEPAFRQQLKSLELTPTELTFSGVSVPVLLEKTVQITCHLRFNIRDMLSAADAPVQYATLCDKVTALATATSATVSGPKLGVEDAQTVEDSAVARAIEKAYPRGRAAAQIMSGQIVAVDKIVIQYVSWKVPSGPNEIQPDLRRLVCSASVRVTYAFSL